MDPSALEWIVLKAANAVLRSSVATEEEAGTALDALKQLLCGYFTAEGRCLKRQGKTISPVGGMKVPEGHCLKVRLALPGRGKKGGLRLAVVAFCDQKRVVVANAMLRRDDPTDDEFRDAFQSAIGT